MKVVWVVDWSDLSSVWSTKEKVLEYLRGEMKRINATMITVEDWDCYLSITVQYEDGTTELFYCVQYEVDELPYV